MLTRMNELNTVQFENKHFKLIKNETTYKGHTRIQLSYNLIFNDGSKVFGFTSKILRHVKNHELENTSVLQLTQLFK